MNGAVNVAIDRLSTNQLLIYNRCMLIKKQKELIISIFYLSIALESATAIGDLLQFNPDFSMSVSPLSPSATLDYYCMELKFDGTSAVTN